jgi:hypothetical protein
MQRLLYILSAGLICTVSAWSCADHDLADFGTCPDYSYSNDVKPIITMKCALSGCHDGSLGADRNWTNLEAFQAKASIAKEKIQSHVMPPPGSAGGELSEDQISILSCWIDAGAPNN